VVVKSGIVASLRCRTGAATKKGRDATLFGEYPLAQAFSSLNHPTVLLATRPSLLPRVFFSES